MIKAPFLTIITLQICFCCTGQTKFYVAVNGNDENPGTLQQPFASWQRAGEAAKNIRSSRAVNIFFRKGTYYLPHTLLFGPDASGKKESPVTYQSYPGEKVTISGAKRLEDLSWTAWKNGIYKCTVPASIDFDQLFINGTRQVCARFPNYDYDNPLRDGHGYQSVVNGSNKRYDTWLEYDPAIFSGKHWSNPSTGIVHAFQSHNWGNMQYRIKGVDSNKHRILLGEGGWQLQRGFGIGKTGAKGSPFFVENIFEELDTPGEWFFNKDQHTLYYYPFSGTDVSRSVVEVVLLEDLIDFKGTAKDPVKYITLKGFDFTQTRTTFMEPYEPLGRGDWAIHRGGAIFMEGTENCSIEDCSFEYTGSNAVFMSKYSKNNQVFACRFYHTGESAVCLVGDTTAVRNYMTWDDEDLRGKKWDQMYANTDTAKGPASPDYPRECVIKNCIASGLGDFGKQVAGVFISMSAGITVSHCTIYDVPRAAICINDGTWSGHIIEYCDIWNTVRETGEHGPFNSWGRDRMWPYNDNKHTVPESVLLDATTPTIIRNNRITNLRRAVSAGNWAIDLDDGSSNYEICDNLCLGSTLKLREGYFRKVRNNIFVSAVPMGWHVWPADSGDEFYNNISVISGAVPGDTEPTKIFIRPVKMPQDTKWGNRIDNNLYYNVNYNDPQVCPGMSEADWRQKGYDRHSLFTNPLFMDPSKEDYRVKANSPALSTGFKNFPMDQFGHTMTRIEPYGGEFKNEVLVTLKPDARGGQVRYTLDGTMPSVRSHVYTLPFKINRTTVIRAQTFKNGVAEGFESQAVFTATGKVNYASWYQVLLKGKHSPGASQAEKQEVLEWLGARLTDISGGDMIDAMGGFTDGVFMEKVPPASAAYRAGFRISDIIIQWDGYTVNNIKNLREITDHEEGKKAEVIVLRGYKKVAVKFKFIQKQQTGL